MKFKIGDRVEDEDFGKGTVIEINTGCEKRSVLVKFDKKNWKLHNGNDCCLKGPYEENSCWFYSEYNQEELKLIKEYDYEDLKKAPIGTKITFENGTVLVKDSLEQFESASYIKDLSDLKKLENKTLGKIIKIEEPEYKTVYEAKSDILDEAEKRYLRGVIRPFKDKVEYVKKFKDSSKNLEFITISFKDDADLDFPYFEEDTMYKGMKSRKEYTLEELGL